MTEKNTFSLPASKHYRVRKEIIWLGVLIVCAYVATDWWMHLNWPPHDGRNKDVVKKLECNWEKYTLHHKDISEISATGGGSDAVDRQMFFDQPQCAAALYLYSEGTGVRLQTRVYDLQKKRRTATIVTTFNKYEGE